MKKLALLALLAGGLFLSGCDAPGYTMAERLQIIQRNWGWEYSQIWDDVDEVLLLRPTDHLSQWDVQ